MRYFTPEEKEQYTKSINKVYKPTGYSIYGKREFTPEEKELIINTPITMDCFEKGENVTFNYERIFNRDFDFCNFLIAHLETLRQKYNETKDERYFIELIRLLPNSYKVVKL